MYNVRLTLADNELKDDLIEHLYKKHLPEIVKTGYFPSFTFEVDYEHNVVIARYPCESQEIYNAFQADCSDSMRSEVLEKFPNSVLNSQRNLCLLRID